MYVIIFVLVTIVLTAIFYKTEQCSSNSDLFGCFLISLGIQVALLGLVGAIYTLYVLKPL